VPDACPFRWSAGGNSGASTGRFCTESYGYPWSTALLRVPRVRIKAPSKLTVSSLTDRPRVSALGDDGRMTNCQRCGADVSPDGPAVEFVGGGTYWWVPFVEDLRRTSPTLIHWRCYMDQNRADALLALITASDRERRDFIRLLRRKLSEENERKPADPAVSD
jgi:hypothetical protein